MFIVYKSFSQACFTSILSLTSRLYYSTSLRKYSFNINQDIPFQSIQFIPIILRCVLQYLYGFPRGYYFSLTGQHYGCGNVLTMVWMCAILHVSMSFHLHTYWQWSRPDIKCTSDVISESHACCFLVLPTSHAYSRHHMIIHAKVKWRSVHWSCDDALRSYDNITPRSITEDNLRADHVTNRVQITWRDAHGSCDNMFNGHVSISVW